MGVSQILEGAPWLTPKVYAYEKNKTFKRFRINTVFNLGTNLLLRHAPPYEWWAKCISSFSEDCPLFSGSLSHWKLF